MTAFKEIYGSNIHDITNYMLQNDLGAATEALFDGDVNDPSARRLLEDPSFREQQGEEDCQIFHQSALAASLATNTASETMRDFHAPASKKTPP